MSIYLRKNTFWHILPYSVRRHQSQHPPEHGIQLAYTWCTHNECKYCLSEIKSRIKRIMLNADAHTKLIYLNQTVWLVNLSCNRPVLNFAYSSNPHNDMHHLDHPSGSLFVLDKIIQYRLPCPPQATML